AVGYDAAWIAVADLNRDGKQDLIVASEGCSPCASGQLPGGVYVLLGNGDGTFRAGVNVAKGVAGALAVADVNGDGKLDVMVSSQGSNFFNVLLGNGDGTFQAPKEAITGPSIGGDDAVFGDFNGDGKVDFVTVDASTGNLAMLPGNGDGTFGNPVISGTQPIFDSFLYLAAADLNGDHKLDIVTVDSASNYLQVWLGKGDGTFEPPTKVTVGEEPTQVEIADVNGDGKLDLLAINGKYPCSFSVLLGNGNGTFQTAVNYIPTGNAIRSMALADFNGDHKLDLVITAQVVKQPTGVFVVLGNGDGTFQTAPEYTAGMFPQSAAIGDLNHDGIPDVVAASNGSNTVSVLLGKGKGVFRPAVNYAAGSGATTVVIADFNGDGKPDLAVSDIGPGTISILLGKGDGTFQSAKPTSVNFGDSGLAAGDFNKDGKQDLAVVSLLGVTVLLGKGDGTFQSSGFSLPYGTRSGIGNIVAVDLNGDGKLDLAVSNQGSNTISILMGNGDGTFQSNVDYTADTNSSVQNLALADFNGDGKLDLVVSDFGCNGCSQPGVRGDIAVLMGNGDGTFRKAVYYQAEGIIQSVAVGDFNGDGKPDVAVSNFLTYGVAIFLNNGDGTFQSPVDFGADNGTGFVAVGDLNGDGKPDIVAVNSGASDIGILLNSCACSGSSCGGATAVLNGASFGPKFAAGQWITIEGTNIYSGSPQVLSFANGSYPTSSNGVSITVEGEPAFLYYLSANQINAVAPDLSGSGPVEVILTNNHVAGEPVQAQLESFAPAFFTWPGGYAVATDQNFNLKVKSGEFSGLNTAPAAPGDVLILWGTGFGPSSPAVAAGHQVPSDRAYNVANAVEVKVGEMAAKVYGAAFAPGFAALVQVAIQVPQLSDGDYPVVATVGGESSPGTVMLTVKK
ncbi:MAG TPA: FG-GAP-like repeat-containing protein, partial [Bryobacteraceae bacterium]|nr:FG-GAP-like repeat-containing protein [Bryobacteraceae bacterium]